MMALLAAVMAVGLRAFRQRHAATVAAVVT
jgi:hypothetical protein